MDLRMESMKGLFDGNKTLSDLIGCQTSIDIMDCTGNCFNNIILSFIYEDGNCDDGAFGIDLNCEEYYFDMGDCNDTDYSLMGICSDHNFERGEPLLNDLKMDIKIKMTESDYEYPFIYFENDGTFSSGITSMPFELSSNQEISNSFQGDLDALILFNLSGNDTLGLSKLSCLSVYGNVDPFLYFIWLFIPRKQ